MACARRRTDCRSPAARHAFATTVGTVLASVLSQKPLSSGSRRSYVSGL